MRFDRDTLTEILDTLTRNRSRSFLTAFGVFWGIFMLVLLSGGGNGLKQMLYSQFDGFATNSGFTFSNNTSMPYKGFNKGRYWDIERKDLDAIRDNIDEIDVLAGESSVWSKTVVYNDNKYNDCTVKGLEAAYDGIEHQPMKYGRFINEIDNRESRTVVVLGKQVYEALFKKGEDPCGRYVSIDGIHYCVIGVSVSESNINVNGSTRESAMVPLSTLTKTYNMGNTVHVIAYTAKKGVKVSDVETKIADLLKSIHLIHPDDKQAVSAINAEEMFQMMDNLFIGLDILIWMVGLGTLLAGAIGVSNIMMVTIKERTSEIGIRRAIGAHTSDILLQIIAECLVLTTIAGLAGLSFGVGVLNIADTLISASQERECGFIIELSTGIGVTIVLAVLGVLAALAPALRAMAIKPIEAMREE